MKTETKSFCDLINNKIIEEISKEFEIILDWKLRETSKDTYQFNPEITFRKKEEEYKLGWFILGKPSFFKEPILLPKDVLELDENNYWRFKK